MDTILVYIAIGIGAINLLLLLWVIFRSEDLSPEVHEILRKDDITERVLMRNPKIKDWVNGAIREYNAQMIRRESAGPQSPISTDEFNRIVNEAVEVVLDKVEKRHHVLIEQERRLPENRDEALPTVSLYASSYDTEGRRFYSVSQAVADDTIFVIKLSAPNAIAGNLSIAESAHDKIIQCRDYLNGACQVAGNGERIKILNEGIVTFQGANWKIEVPMEVEFY